MPFYTPLRYPGGKRRLASLVMRLLAENELQDVSYYEPYAGGSAIALALLMEEYASVVHMNDLSRAVYAFWSAVLNDTNELCRRIMTVKLDMPEWQKQRNVYDQRATSDLSELGFATLFLNRTNRSGILGGGVIGGKTQTGTWHLDARFNRIELVNRIRRISRYKNRIKLYQLDAAQFTSEVVSKADRDSFAFYDPPYIENGKGLYLNDYSLEGHRALADQVALLSLPWVVTYDYSAVRHKLYSKHRRLVYGLNYSAQGRYEGKEVMFVSDHLALPPEWSELDRFTMSGDKSSHPLFGAMESQFESERPVL